VSENLIPPPVRNGMSRLRAAHSAYNAGNREPYVVEAERVYNAWRHLLSYHRRKAIDAGYDGCGCERCQDGPLWGAA
jgi:hypothetical protein